MTAFGVRPRIVALDADQEAAGKLIIAAGLRPAEPPVRLVSAERLAEKGAAGRAHNPVLLLRPQPAGMAAEITAGPAPNRHDRHRLIDRGPHVGRDRWSRQHNQRGRSEQDFSHQRAPPSGSSSQQYASNPRGTL